MEMTKEEEEIKQIQTEKKKENKSTILLSESAVVEIETVMVALLGVVLLIAGGKHALASLVEQWRATVFLFLNLLLLAILFTSSNSNNNNNKSSSRQQIKIKSDMIKTPNNKQIKNKQINIKSSSSSSSSSASVQMEDYLRNIDHQETMTTRIVGKVEKDEGDDHDKEDLNARVEAFIVMFRQQLALDNIAKERRISTSRFSSSSSSVSFASSTTQLGAPPRRASFAL